MDTPRFIPLTLILLGAASGCEVRYAGSASSTMYTAEAPMAVAVEAPPPPAPMLAVARPVAPSEAAVWVDGYHEWRGGSYVWVEGHFENPQPGTVWQQPVYARGRYHPGYWRPVAQPVDNLRVVRRAHHQHARRPAADLRRGG